MKNFYISKLFDTALEHWKAFEICYEQVDHIARSIPNRPGIYQIKTNAPIKELQLVSSRQDTSHYNFKKKIEASLLLPKGIIISENVIDGYVVYTGHQAKLRQRFREHFMGSKGTGCLNIFENVHLRDYQWWFEFYDCTNALSNYQDSKLYRTYLEQLHRSHIGWPILCSQ